MKLMIFADLLVACELWRCAVESSGSHIRSCAGEGEQQVFVLHVEELLFIRVIKFCLYLPLHSAPVIPDSLRSVTRTGRKTSVILLQISVASLLVAGCCVSESAGLDSHICTSLTGSVWLLLLTLGECGRLDPTRPQVCLIWFDVLRYLGHIWPRQQLPNPNAAQIRPTFVCCLGTR